MMPQNPSNKLQRSLEELSAQGVQFLPVAQLKPWKDNPNQHEEGVPRLLAIIQRYGWTVPLIVRMRADPDGRHEMAAGHGRLKAAAEQLGLDKVPVIFRDFTAHESHGYALADNKAPEFSQDDPGKLREVLQQLMEDERDDLDDDADQVMSNLDDILAAGYTQEEIDTLLAGEDPNGPVEEPEKDRAPGEAVIQYNIVFETEAQRDAWYKHLKALRKQYPQHDTHAARILAFVAEGGCASNRDRLPSSATKDRRFNSVDYLNAWRDRQEYPKIHD